MDQESLGDMSSRFESVYNMPTGDEEVKDWVREQMTVFEDGVDLNSTQVQAPICKSA